MFSLGTMALYRSCREKITKTVISRSDDASTLTTKSGNSNASGSNSSGNSKQSKYSGIQINEILKFIKEKHSSDELLIKYMNRLKQKLKASVIN